MTRTSFALSDENAAKELIEESESHWKDVQEALNASQRRLELASTRREPFRVLHEARALFHLAAPSVLIQFSLFFIFPQAASAVGRHLGTVALAGFSLGSLVGNLTCLSIMEGALTAADTLMPRAFGNERYDEVARLVVRASVVVSLLLIPPVIPLCFFSSAILTALGQDPEASFLAQEWIRMYFLGVPPNLAYRVAMRFLLAQNQPWPHVYSSILPCLVINPLLLRLLVPRMGLPGSALAITFTQWSMMFVLVVILWLRPHHKPETWPGLSIQLLRESFSLRPLWNFASLSLGGVLSLSEWWFWEAMCFIAGSFGVVSLCVHTIAYNLVPLLFMLPLGIMIGLAVRMGYAISFDPHRAKLMAAYSTIFITAVGFLVTSLLYIFRLSIILLFTKDNEVVQGCLKIWPDVCWYIFLLYIFGISSAVYRGLGMQWRLAVIVTTSLYIFLLPTVIYFAVIKGGGLYMQWRLLPVFYTMMQVVLILGYVLVDWDAHSETIRIGLQRSILEAKGIHHTNGSSNVQNGNNDSEPVETTPLL